MLNSDVQILDLGVKTELDKGAFELTEPPKHFIYIYVYIFTYLYIYYYCDKMK